MNDFIIIPLSKRGKKYKGMYETKVSPEHADLAELNWTLATDFKSKTHYAHRMVKKTRVTLHRVILERVLGRPLEKWEEVDHVDNDGLNNLNENLRLATHTQNCINRGKIKSNTSGYKGVNWHVVDKKWQARISINGKRKFLGYFNTPEEAYAAYCEAADKYHQAFANKG